MSRNILTTALAVTSLVCACEGNSCFVARTQVLTKSGWRAISELAIGDEVVAYSAVERLVFARVERIHTARVREVHEIKLGSCCLVGVTATHPVYSQRDSAFVAAGALLEGAVLMGLVQSKDVAVLEWATALDTVQSHKVIHLDEDITVYNLTVSGPATYFADGVLVHNKEIVDYDVGADAAGADSGAVIDAADTSTGDAQDGGGDAPESDAAPLDSAPPEVAPPTD